MAGSEMPKKVSAIKDILNNFVEDSQDPPPEEPENLIVK
jgi:hypothetical protein